MKSLKMVMICAAVAGMFTFSACSSTKKQTTEATAVPAITPVETAQVSSTPAYTMANLGASTAGRSK